jgi:hypothetical protein
VGRPPQELMRGWGKAPIYKAFIPNHRLGIRATNNLVEEGKKERHGEKRNRCEEKQRRDTKLSSSRKN